jgi:hypothetical protein
MPDASRHASASSASNSPTSGAHRARQHQAHVKVFRGQLNDRLFISLSGILPNLEFDMFTVQRSNLGEDGQTVENFPGFGLALVSN